MSGGSESVAGKSYTNFRISIFCYLIVLISVLGLSTLNISGRRPKCLSPKRMLPTSGPLKPSTITLSTPSLLGAARTTTTLLLPPTLQSARVVFVDPTGAQAGLLSSQPPSILAPTTTNSSVSVINNSNDFYGGFYPPSHSTTTHTPQQQQQQPPLPLQQSAYHPNIVVGQDEMTSSYMNSSTLPSPLYTPHLVSTSKNDERFSFASFEPTSFPGFPNILPNHVDTKNFANLDDIDMYFDGEKREKSEHGLSTPSSGDYSSDSDPQNLPTDGRTPKRREKKKQQNREAATRYREKKRKEREEAKQKEDILRQHNLSLRTKMSEIQTEIDYLKRLMHEIGMHEDHIKYISPVVPL